MNNIRHRPQVQWSDEERTELRRLRENGVTMKQIAKMMGRGVGSIEQQCKRLGLPKLPSPIRPPAERQEPRRVPPGASTLPPLPSLSTAEAFLEAEHQRRTPVHLQAQQVTLSPDELAELKQKRGMQASPPLPSLEAMGWNDINRKIEASAFAVRLERDFQIRQRFNSCTHDWEQVTAPNGDRGYQCRICRGTRISAPPAVTARSQHDDDDTA